MGNSGSALLALTSDSRNAGDSILGKSVIRLKKFFPELEISLVFVGKEWSKGKGGSGQTHTFLEIQNEVTPPDGWKVAVYQIPFSVSLPSGLLPSTVINYEGSWHCKVSYSIILKKRTSRSSKWENFSKEIPVTILGPRKFHISQSLPVPIIFIKNVNAFATFSRGNIAVGIYIRKDIVDVKEKVVVSYAFENYSNATIKTVKIRLVELLTWANPEPGKTVSIELIEKRVELNQAVMMEATPLSKRSGNVAVPEDDSLAQQLNAALESERNTVELRLPKKIKPDLAGKEVSITHEAVLECVTSFGNENILVRAPFTVVRDDGQVPDPSANAVFDGLAVAMPLAPPNIAAASTVSEAVASGQPGSLWGSSSTRVHPTNAVEEAW